MKSKFFLILLLFFLFGCAHQANDIFTVSTSKEYLFANVPKLYRPEAEYGYSVYLKVYASLKVNTDKKYVQLIDKIGSKLAKGADRKYFNYTFTLIDDKGIFTTSTPGGFVYISTGMMKYLKNEDELASVLANEIALIQHVLMRFRQIKRSADLAEELSQYAGFALGGYGAVVLPKGVKLLNNVLLRERPRVDRIIEADNITIDLLKKAGYNPEALLLFTERVATEYADKASDLQLYKRLHPITRERIRNMKTVLRTKNE